MIPDNYSCNKLICLFKFCKYTNDQIRFILQIWQMVKIAKFFFNKVKNLYKFVTKTHIFVSQKSQ